MTRIFTHLLVTISTTTIIQLQTISSFGFTATKARLKTNKKHASFFPMHMKSSDDNDNAKQKNIKDANEIQKVDVTKDNSASAFDGTKFITTQKGYSKSLLPLQEELTKEEYLKHQEAIFDKSASFFADDELITPIEIRPAIRHIVTRFLKDVLKSKSKSNSNGTIKLLDVGCGTSVLFPYILEAITKLNITEKVDYVGIDLSKEMINKATERVQELKEYDSNQISFELIHGDYVTWVKEEEQSDLFDGILMNAVFGNFYDLKDVMSSTSKKLAANGIFCISHPLGSLFQEKLHKEDPLSVRFTLPTSPQLRALIQTYPLQIIDMIQQVNLFNHEKEIQSFDVYYAALRKVNYSSLGDVMKFRGCVASGYGRGGKTLGVPTANLPETLFSHALEDVKTGVYFGWAVIEQQISSSDKKNTLPKPGRNVYQKAVVNIGYSPTFTNEENPTKIIEAHLIIPEEERETITDFYNETMRLQLIGYIRPEQKFASFQDLKDQIALDIHTADAALSTQPYASFRMDTFLVDPCQRGNEADNDVVTWVGKDGGNVNASWEFEEWVDVIDSLPVGDFL